MVLAGTPKVEVAFATQPMSGSPVFTDITPWLLDTSPLQTQRGAPNEFTQTQPATLGFVLNNSDGRFTRGRTASPYYPNVRNGRRIRYSITHASITYYRFDGHVNEWPTTWDNEPGGWWAPGQITATDGLTRLGGVGEFRAMVSEEILLDGVAPDATHGAAYYPLGESNGALSAGNVTPQVQDPARIVQRGAGGTLEFGQGTGPGTDELSAPQLAPVDAQNGKYLKALLRTGVGLYGATLECFMRCDPGAVGRTIAALADPFDNRIILSVNSSGQLTALSWQARHGEVYRLDAAGPQINDNATHHVAVTEQLSGSTVTAVLYLDGAQVATTTYTSTALMTADRLFVGGDPWERWGVFGGTLSHAAAHSSVLSAARIATHYNAGTNGLQGESADTRIGRFADWIKIPLADRALDVSASTMGAQQTARVQPIEAMRQVEALEQGVLFISGDGKLTFHSRNRRYNLAPAFTLDCAQGHIPPDLEFPGDDFGLTNDYTVSRPDGASERITDQASIDEYGLYRDSKEIPAGSSDELRSAASWRVFNYSQPRTRISQVTVNLHDPRVASLIPQLLAADISTKIRLANLPSQAPATTIDVFVEGVAEQRTIDTWTLSFNCSPGDIYDVWQLGIAGRSELGVTTKLAMRSAAAPADLWPDTWPTNWP
jgi:hypothetical protein